MNHFSKRLPALFISHGGGPWPFMQPAFGPPGMWQGLDAFLRGIAADVGRKPAAVLAVSGHWQEKRPTVNSGARPSLLFDYYGFPEHTYRLVYPAPGSPAIAVRVKELLGSVGIESGEDGERGFDHGIFIPFMLAYPGADVPIVQLSLQCELNPEFHLAIGRALAPLRDEDVLMLATNRLVRF